MTLLSRKLLVPSRGNRKPSLDLREATEAKSSAEGIGGSAEGSRHIRRFGTRVVATETIEAEATETQDGVTNSKTEIREAQALFGWGRKKKTEAEVGETKPTVQRTFGSDMVSEPEVIDDDFEPEPPVPEEERVVTDDDTELKEKAREVYSGDEQQPASESVSEPVSEDSPELSFGGEGVSEPVPLEDEADDVDEGESERESNESDHTEDREEQTAESESQRASLEPGEGVKGPVRIDENEDNDDEIEEDDSNVTTGDTQTGEPVAPVMRGAGNEEPGSEDMTARDAGPIGEQIGPEEDLSDHAQSAIMTIEGSQAHALSASHGLPLRRRNRHQGEARESRDAGSVSPIEVDKLAVTTVDMDWPDRRRSIRMRMNRMAGFAPLPKKLEEDLTMSDLQWRATSTVNFSSGGALMELDDKFDVDDLLLIHLDMGDLFFPPFALGRVSYTQEIESGRYRTGVMFITNEDKEEYLPAEVVERLPGEVFDYRGERSCQIETTIAAWKRQSQSLVSQEENK
jgi:hypothetical protein